MPPTKNTADQPIPSSNPPSTELSSSPPGPPGQPGQLGKVDDPTRCFTCSKKVGLLGFKCRCDHVYCSRHRYSEDHQCPIDYKQIHQEKLRKENPTISNPKVPRI